MLVGFLHVGSDATLPTLMVKSAKKLGYELLQMTDEETPVVAGVSRVSRLPWNKTRLMTYRMAHLAAQREPMCVVDTDILFMSDISDIWQRDFEAALTKREGPIYDKNGVDVAKIYPYNCGVMFCRNKEFWKYAFSICSRLPEQLQNWYGDQEGVKWASRKFRTLELPCDEWNYTPASLEDTGNARILHLKGRRKPWMEEFAKQMGIA